MSVAESFRASCHGWSTIKWKLSKSAFSEGVRHFERQFQVDWDVARNRSMDRWIGEWCSYNFAAESFHTKKLGSTLFSREVEFYWHKRRYRVFVPPFGGLRGNVHGLSMARWKARGQLLLHCVSKKRPTFKLSLTVSNLNRFSKFLYCWKAYEIYYKRHIHLTLGMLLHYLGKLNI